MTVEPQFINLAMRDVNISPERKQQLKSFCRTLDGRKSHAPSSNERCISPKTVTAWAMELTESGLVLAVASSPCQYRMAAPKSDEFLIPCYMMVPDEAYVSLTAVFLLLEIVANHTLDHASCRDASHDPASSDQVSTTLPQYQ